MSATGLRPGAPPASRAVPRPTKRRLAKAPPEPVPRSAEFTDLDDAGGIPRSLKLLVFVGILVLVPLVIGAVFVVLILLRVKLGN